MAILAAVLFLFWNLLSGLPTLWIENDYYSHGFLILPIVGYTVYKWWPKIKELPVRPGYLALPFLAAFIFVYHAAAVTDLRPIQSACFIGSLLSGIWFVGGFRWMIALFSPTAYLVFMLPVWNSAIDNYTNALQLISDKVAYHILNLLGQQPLQTGPTDILVKGFQLNVAVPCSGLKLLLAVTAFTFFFLMISNLKWWGRGVLLALILPLCLFINGLRIALIGMVGGQWGDEAGHKFHDYSGYITLVVCFFILFKVARSLGWKD